MTIEPEQNCGSNAGDFTPAAKIYQALAAFWLAVGVLAIKLL